MSTLLSQRRARYALDCVRRAQSKDDKFQEDYSRWCERLPAMILGNGVGQAVAFLRADSKGEQGKASLHLYRDLSDWIARERQIYTGSELLDGLCTGDRAQYVQAQRECSEILGWLKRFSTAYLKKPEQQ